MSNTNKKVIGKCPWCMNNCPTNHCSCPCHTSSVEKSHKCTLLSIGACADCTTNHIDKIFTPSKQEEKCNWCKEPLQSNLSCPDCERLKPTPSTEKKCECKEMTCYPETCKRNHTHKQFWCEKCDPQKCRDMESSPQPSSWAENKLDTSGTHYTTPEEIYKNTFLRGSTGVATYIQKQKDERKEIWMEGFKAGYLQAQTEERRRLVGEIEGLEYDFYKIPMQYATTPKDEKIYKEVLKYIINLINK